MLLNSSRLAKSRVGRGHIVYGYNLKYFAESGQSLNQSVCYYLAKDYRSDLANCFYVLPKSWNILNIFTMCSSMTNYI